MKPPNRVLVCVLAALALLATASCSDGDSALNASRGNVRVVLTASGTATAAATEAAPGSNEAGAPPVTVLHRDDDDDDDDDDSGDGENMLPRLAEANATFSSLLARNLDGQLIDLAVDLPRTVNLLGLMGGGSIELPMGTLPAGTYDEMVVVITQLELVLRNEARVALTPPGGGWTSIVPVRPFEVIDGEVITIELRFDPRQAFRQFGGVFRFHPQFDCERR